MVCPKCNNSAVLNEALGKEFYYCRTCKDEVVLQSPQALLDQIAEQIKLVQAPGSGLPNPPPISGLPYSSYRASLMFGGARHTIIAGSELYHACVIGTPLGCSSAKGPGWHLMTIKHNGHPDYMDEVSEQDLMNLCQPIALAPTVARGTPIGATSASPPNWFRYPPVPYHIGHQLPKTGHPQHTQQAPQNPQKVPPPPPSNAAGVLSTSEFNARKADHFWDLSGWAPFCIGCALSYSEFLRAPAYCASKFSYAP